MSKYKRAKGGRWRVDAEKKHGTCKGSAKKQRERLQAKEMRV
jgi:hypothetical protein